MAARRPRNPPVRVPLDELHTLAYENRKSTAPPIDLGGFRADVEAWGGPIDANDTVSKTAAETWARAYFRPSALRWEFTNSTGTISPPVAVARLREYVDRQQREAATRPGRRPKRFTVREYLDAERAWRLHNGQYPADGQFDNWYGDKTVQQLKETDAATLRGNGLLPVSDDGYVTQRNIDRLVREVPDPADTAQPRQDAAVWDREHRQFIAREIGRMRFLDGVAVRPQGEGWDWYRQWFPDHWQELEGMADLARRQLPSGGDPINADIVAIRSLQDQVPHAQLQVTRDIRLRPSGARYDTHYRSQGLTDDEIAELRKVVNQSMNEDTALVRVLRKRDSRLEGQHGGTTRPGYAKAQSTARHLAFDQRHGTNVSGRNEAVAQRRQAEAAAKNAEVERQVAQAEADLRARFKTDPTADLPTLRGEFADRLTQGNIIGIYERLITDSIIAQAPAPAQEGPPAETATASTPDPEPQPDQPRRSRQSTGPIRAERELLMRPRNHSYNFYAGQGVGKAEIARIQRLTQQYRLREPLPIDAERRALREVTGKVPIDNPGNFRSVEDFNRAVEAGDQRAGPRSGNTARQPRTIQRKEPDVAERRRPLNADEEVLVRPGGNWDFYRTQSVPSEQIDEIRRRTESYKRQIRKAQQARTGHATTEEIQLEAETRAVQEVTGKRAVPNPDRWVTVRAYNQSVSGDTPAAGSQRADPNAIHYVASTDPPGNRVSPFGSRDLAERYVRENPDGRRLVDADEANRLRVTEDYATLTPRAAREALQGQDPNITPPPRANRGDAQRYVAATDAPGPRVVQFTDSARAERYQNAMREDRRFVEADEATRLVNESGYDLERQRVGDPGYDRVRRGANTLQGSAAAAEPRYDRWPVADSSNRRLHEFTDRATALKFARDAQNDRTLVTAARARMLIRDDGYRPAPTSPSSTSSAAPEREVVPPARPDAVEQERRLLAGQNYQRQAEGRNDRAEDLEQQRDAVGQRDRGPRSQVRTRREALTRATPASAERFRAPRVEGQLPLTRLDPADLDPVDLDALEQIEERIIRSAPPDVRRQLIQDAIEAENPRAYIAQRLEVPGIDEEPIGRATRIRDAAGARPIGDELQAAGPRRPPPDVPSLSLDDTRRAAGVPVPARPPAPPGPGGGRGLDVGAVEPPRLPRLPRTPRLPRPSFAAGLGLDLAFEAALNVAEIIWPDQVDAIEDALVSGARRIPLLNLADAVIADMTDGEVEALRLVLTGELNDDDELMAHVIADSARRAEVPITPASPARAQRNVQLGDLGNDEPATEPGPRVPLGETGATIARPDRPSLFPDDVSHETFLDDDDELAGFGDLVPTGTSTPVEIDREPTLADRLGGVAGAVGQAAGDALGAAGGAAGDALGFVGERHPGLGLMRGAAEFVERATGRETLQEGARSRANANATILRGLADYFEPYPDLANHFREGAADYGRLGQAPQEPRPTPTGEDPEFAGLGLGLEDLPPVSAALGPGRGRSPFDEASAPTPAESTAEVRRGVAAARAERPYDVQWLEAVITDLDPRPLLPSKRRLVEKAKSAAVGEVALTDDDLDAIGVLADKWAQRDLDVAEANRTPDIEGTGQARTDLEQQLSGFESRYQWLINAASDNGTEAISEAEVAAAAASAARWAGLPTSRIPFETVISIPGILNVEISGSDGNPPSLNTIHERLYGRPLGEPATELNAGDELATAPYGPGYSGGTPELPDESVGKDGASTLIRGQLEAGSLTLEEAKARYSWVKAAAGPLLAAAGLSGEDATDFLVSLAEIPADQIPRQIDQYLTTLRLSAQASQDRRELRVDVARQRAGIEANIQDDRNAFFNRLHSRPELLPPPTPGARIGGAELYEHLLSTAGLPEAGFQPIGGALPVPNFRQPYADPLAMLNAVTAA